MSDVTSPDFGDYDEADAFDTAEADPEQVAIFLQKLRRRVKLGRRIDHHDWDDLDADDRERLTEIAERFLAWFRRNGLR
jgi:hypothetical protein